MRNKHIFTLFKFGIIRFNSIMRNHSYYILLLKFLTTLLNSITEVSYLKKKKKMIITNSYFTYQGKHFVLMTYFFSGKGPKLYYSPDQEKFAYTLRRFIYEYNSGYIDIFDMYKIYKFYLHHFQAILFLGQIIVSYFFAFILSIAFEAPIVSLLKLVSPTKRNIH